MSGLKVISTETVCPLCLSTQGLNELAWQKYQLIRCKICNLVYAWPCKIPADLYDKAYNEQGDYQYYLPGESESRKQPHHLTWAMRNFLNSIIPKNKLLDIGCSTGKFLFSAQQLGWDVYGLEVSQRAASIAQHLTGAPVFTQEITQFYPNEKFYAITAWEVLEHVQDPLTFVQSAKGLLETGGVLALSVPNWNSPWMKRSNKQEHWPPYHLTFWNRETLQLFLQKAGFMDIVIKEKPFAWEEEVGRLKWVYLPFALLRSGLLKQRGMHLYAIGRKP